MKKKVLITLAVVFALAFALSSCKASANENTGETPAVGSNVVFSPDVDVALVKSAADMTIDLITLGDAIYAQTGRFATQMLDTNDKEPHEIVFGNTSRDISAKAMAAVNEGLNLKIRDMEDKGEPTDFVIGYGVYAEGGSVALVWSSEEAFTRALTFFIDNFLNAPTLVLEDGYLFVQTVDLIEVLEEEEAAKKEEVYANIEMDFGPEVVTALKNHLSMFDDRYYMWLADLYDPGEYDENGNPLGGGFYYSNSGRDNPGYGIDLESTMQALSWITGASGLYDGASAKDYLPESMFHEMAAFALSCQSSTDGYFYHPQWGDNVSTSRIGRDLGWATSILSTCGYKPYWNTPGGGAGYYGEPDGDDTKKDMPLSEYYNLLKGVAPASSLTGRITGSAAVAVSKVIPAAKKWNGSAWLATIDAWEEYILSYEANITTSSYSIGNNFSAQSAQIKNRDKLAIQNGEFPDADKDGIADGGYIETWEKYFNSWQREDNGLWEECSVEDGTVYYNAINGLMKVSSCYNSLGIKFNYADKAFRCAMYIATYLGNGSSTGNDAEDWKDSKGKYPSGSVDVYNPWVAMSALISNVNKFGDKDEAAALRQLIKDNAYEMITITTTKVAKFAKDDGSYGYTWGASPSKSQGAPVAVPGAIEGDINGGNIAFTGVFTNMRNALGITSALKPYGLSDGLKFALRIKELQPVLKEDGSLDDPSSSVSGEYNFDEEIADSTTAENVSFSFDEGSASIVKDPENSNNLYLRFVAKPGDTGGNSFTIKAKKASSVSGLVLEWRMKFESIGKNNTTAFQINMGGSYMLTLGINTNGTFSIGDSSSTGSGVKNFFQADFSAYEWNKIRVEYYVLDAAEKSTITQIYVNDELRFVSSNYYDKQSNADPKTAYDTARFFSLKATDTICYFDDMYAYQISSPYVEKPIVNPDLVKDFDNVEAGGDKLPKGVTTTGGEVVAAPTDENPANNIFVLSGNESNVSVQVSNSSPSPNCYTVSTKIKIESTATGDVAMLYLAGDSTSFAIMAYKVTVYETADGKFIKLTPVNKAGDVGEAVEGLPYGEWFTLGVDFYPYFYLEDNCAIVYADGVEVGRTNLNYYIGTVSTPYNKFIFKTTSDSVTVSLDDITPERVKKAFLDESGNAVEDPDVDLPTSGKGSSTSATADHDGRFDFEGVALGTPKVPGLTTNVNTNEYGYYLDIKQDPTNAANQVLSHIVVSSKNYGNTASYTASKQSPADANVHVFEFDVLVAKAPSCNIQTSFNGSIVGADGKSKSVKLFQTNIHLGGTYNNSTLNFHAKRDNTTDLSSHVDPTATPDKSINTKEILSTVRGSGWINIRMELYVDQGIVQIYYDGEYRGETDIVYTHQMGAKLTSTNIYTTYGSNCEIYFDNVIVESIKKDYVAQTCADPTAKVGDGATPGADPVEPDDSDDSDEPASPIVPDAPTKPADFNGTYDFEDQQILTFNAYGVKGSFPAGGRSYVAEDPVRSANKVLEFVTIGRNQSGSNENVNFEIATLGGAAKYVFEWEMRFSKVNNSSTNIMQLGLGEVYMLAIDYNSSDNTYSIGDMSSTSGASEWYSYQPGFVKGISCTDWTKFKVEYALVGDRAMIKVYVNDELKVVSDNHYGQTPADPAFSSLFTNVMFRSTNIGDFTVHIDNAKFYGSEEAIGIVDYTHQVNVDFNAEPTIIDGAVSDFDTTDNITKDTKDPIATYEVVTDPLATEAGDAVNKVLKVTVDGSETTYDGNTVKTFNVGEAKNVGTYEFAFDMLFDVEIPTNDIVIQQFVMNSGSQAMLFSMKLKNNGTFQITQDAMGRDGVTYGKYALLASGLDLGDGQWHNLRFVVLYNGTDTVVKFYYDGELKKEVNTYFYDAACTNGNPLQNTVWRVNDLVSGSSEVLDSYTVYIDNMYFVYVPDEDAE